MLAMQYGQGYTAGIFKGQEESGWAKKSPYRDVPDGQDHLEAVHEGNIEQPDMVLMLSIDGAWICQYKASDRRIYIWIILDLEPALWYEEKHILPGGFIPGPNKPKNLDGFIFSGLRHLAAIRREGLRVWMRAMTAISYLTRFCSWLLMGQPWHALTAPLDTMGVCIVVSNVPLLDVTRPVVHAAILHGSNQKGTLCQERSP